MIVGTSKTQSRPKPNEELGRLVQNYTKLPPVLQKKSYMGCHLAGYEAELYGQGMGWGIKIKFPKIKIKVPKFISSLGKGLVDFIENTVQEATKAVANVGNVAVSVYEDAKRGVLQISPPFLRPYVGVIIDPVKAVMNPASTIQILTNPAPLIPKGVVLPSVNLYKDVLKPSFNTLRKATDDLIISPATNVVNETVLKALPPDIQEKVKTITELPRTAARGKLRDQDIAKATKSAMQLGVVGLRPMTEFYLGAANVIKRDAILGPLWEKIDLYTGGVLTSAVNLADTPDDIYNDRKIDWKARLIDALKIYLTVVAAGQVSTFVTQMATGYVGEETGLANTAIGRGVLSAGALYYGKFDINNVTGVAIDATKEAAMNIAKAEAINHAVSSGYIDNKYLAKMILSAGSKLYDAQGNELKFTEAMDSIYDKEFQKAFAHEAQRLTGVPLEFRHLVDLYETDWSKLGQSISASIPSLEFPSSNAASDFFKSLGKNLMDELNRTPGNIYKIGDNIYNEILRTPDNAMKFANAVAAEANRTPANIAKIAENIARETSKGAENVVDTVVKAGEDIKNEAVRTPENIQEIAENIARETGRGIDNVIEEIKNIDPKVELPKSVDLSIDPNKLEELLKKYGPDLLAFLQATYGPNWHPYMITDDLETRFLKKKSKAPLILGGLALLAAAYFATED